MRRSGKRNFKRHLVSQINAGKLLLSFRSCGEEEEEGGDDDEEPPSLQEQEIEKMRLLFNQGRLASR